VKSGIFNNFINKNEKNYQKDGQKGCQKSGQGREKGSEKDCEEGRQEGAQIAFRHIIKQQRGHPGGCPFLK
jgi:hypothetical protein